MTQFTRVVNGQTELTADLFNDLQEAIEQTSFNVKRYGATGDGVTDDTAAITNAISALPTNGVLIFPAGYTFLISSNISLSKAMTVMGYGATISGKGLCISAENVSIYGITVDSATAYGIYSRRSRTHIQDCTVTDSGNIGIFIETNATTAASIQDCVVTGCYVDRSSLGNDVTEGGIKVHGYSSGPYVVTGSRISNNTVRMPSTPTDTSAICIEVWGGSPYSVISGNSTYGGDMGISADTSDFTAITGNTVYVPELRGIEVAGGSFCSVTGNTINCGSTTDYGISFSNSNSKYNVVSGNTVRQADLRAIQIHSTDYTNVTGNVVEMNDAGFGIEFLSIDGGVISGNLLYGTSQGTKAIVLDTCTKIAVMGNAAEDWSQHGVMVYADGGETLSDLTIFGNMLNNCTVNYAEVLSGGSTVSHPYVYSVSNVSTDRGYDADNTSDAEVADILGTLIADLQAQGIIR